MPYRDSALTLLLKESLGGNSKTTLIVNCSMDAYNASETLNTMRFGQRAKRIENKPKINMEQTVGELKQQLEAVQHEYRSVFDTCHSPSASTDRLTVHCCSTTEFCRCCHSPGLSSHRAST